MSTSTTADLVAALEIATKLMRRHLDAATPGGAGRDSDAYRAAIVRVELLEAYATALKEVLEAMSMTVATLCSDCHPEGYPTDDTRCTPCPRRAGIEP